MVNIGNSDRAQRIIMGGLLILLNVFNSLNSKWTTASLVSLAIQVELVGTGLIGWCPLHWGMSKYNKNKNKS